MTTTTRPDADQLVGLTEIAERANTTPGTVRSWKNRPLGFPAPVVELATGPVWFWPDVEKWIGDRKRPRGRLYVRDAAGTVRSTTTDDAENA